MLRRRELNTWDAGGGKAGVDERGILTQRRQGRGGTRKQGENFITDELEQHKSCPTRRATRISRMRTGRLLNRRIRGICGTLAAGRRELTKVRTSWGKVSEVLTPIRPQCSCLHGQDASKYQGSGDGKGTNDRGIREIRGKRPK